MTKKHTIAALILNLLLFTITTALEISYFCGRNDAVIPDGMSSFRFFTIDSNLFAALASLIAAICEIRMLSGKADELPRFAVLLKYMATIGLTLTFLVVALYLIPVYGFYTELHDENLHMHVMAPLFCFVTTVFREKSGRITLPESFLGMIPVVLYGAVYFLMVIVIGKENGGWSDFYQFNVGGKWYFIAPVILLFAYGICTVVRLLKNRFSKV